MQVHLLAEIPATFAGVDEFAGELEAVADVVGAATPFPVSHGGRCARLVSVIAGARLNAALAACPRDTVSHRRARDGVDEGGLPTSCNRIAESLRLPCRTPRTSRLLLFLTLRRVLPAFRFTFP